MLALPHFPLLGQDGMKKLEACEVLSCLQAAKGSASVLPDLEFVGTVWCQDGGCYEGLEVLLTADPYRGGGRCDLLPPSGKRPQ